MFCLETRKLKLKLEIVPVASLHQHEEILVHTIDKLVLEFKNWTNLHHPIIIDDHHIVLDGNHRAFAFKKLKFKYIPACKIDYLNKKVELRYWFRVVGQCGDLTIVEKIVRSMGGAIHLVANRNILKAELDRYRFSCGIQLGDRCALVSFPENMIKDAVDAYGALETIQAELKKGGLGLTYTPCNEILDKDTCPFVEDGDLVIWTPRISKEMVIQASSEGKVFPPKSTRHLIPARPLQINVPTHWLKENVSLRVINKKFDDHLTAKTIKRFSPGQVIDGRYYQEELFVFI